MGELPTGTVTFLFTDIEGSTTLAQQFPAAWPALLVRHPGHVFQIVGGARSALRLF
jgi:class 3 adenylate cyclase